MELNDNTGPKLVSTGHTLIWLGGICAIGFAMFFDTSVQTSMGAVANISKMHLQEYGVFAGIGIALSGVITFCAGHIVGRLSAILESRAEVK